MTRYVIKRLLLFIPALVAVSLVAFLILANAPGDPVERFIGADPENATVASGATGSNQREIWTRKLGLDLPLFYFSVNQLSEIKEGTDVTVPTWQYFIPVVQFHGDNRYHRWVFGDGNWSKGIIRGDFGISYQTRQPVSEVIRQRIIWSIVLSAGSVLLAYLISIPIAALSAKRRGSFFDHASSTLLFLLFSMPGFWVATLLLMTFANPDVLHWLPASGVKPVSGYPDGASLLDKIGMSIPYLVLPLICYTYSSAAFLSRTLRSSLLESLTENYSRTARAKGLDESGVVYRHALRNSLLPLITVLAHVFPAAIGGSVILETIFSIPGMGSEIVMAIHNQNYPMVIAVFTITAFLTMAGILVADILYAVADPRIRFNKTK